MVWYRSKHSLINDMEAIVSPYHIGLDCNLKEEYAQ